MAGPRQNSTKLVETCNLKDLRRLASRTVTTEKKELNRKACVTAIFLAVVVVSSAHAQEHGNTDVELANKLSNPISSLISVPFQFNYDSRYGPANGNKAFVNIQPVIPLKLSPILSLVTRTILPVAWQNRITRQFGNPVRAGRHLQSFFLVPQSQKTSLGTFTYGAGPAVSWPTSTDRFLGSGTLGIGPTGVFLFQDHGWTYGALANHVWGIDETRSHMPNLNNTFLQPFIAYNTPDAWTFAINTETNYNWTAKEWSVPINWTVAKLTTIGSQKVQFQAGLRYWAHSAPDGPDGVGARFAVTFLFPD